METLDLFKQILVKISLNEDLNSLSNFCLKIKKENESVQRSNIGGFHSNNLDKKEPLLNSLIKNIELNSNIMIKNIFKNSETVSLFNIWFNINGYKDFNIPHTHPFSKISGVFYVNTPEKSGNLVFLNDTKIENYLHSNKFTEYNEYNSSSYSIKPEENSLYLFPSWLNHYVKPNLSKQKRISISFNLL